MFTEKQLRIIKAQNNEAINRLQEKFNRIELINLYNFPKIDYGYVDQQYLIELKQLDKELESLLQQLEKMVR